VIEDSQLKRSRLREIAFVFLKLGTTAFGGPAAHVAMMDDEIVRKRGWITREEFLDLLSATNFIPGPNSTELAIHIGHTRGGWKGLIVAGGCFILPAALIVTVIAWAYVTYGSLPVAQTILYGVKPVIIAVVFQAIWSLTKTAVKNKTLAILGALAFTSNFLGANELAVIFLCGACSFFLSRYKEKSFWALVGIPEFSKPIALTGVGAVAAGAIVPVTLTKVFLFFLKVGSILFGSGYVLLAFLRTDLVDKWQWLTQSQLLDAIAVGQFTPGPVFTTATFIGYLLGGINGAIVATLGIFLPAFFFVALTAPYIRVLRKSPSAANILDGVNVASLAVMTVTCVFLAKEAILDLSTLVLALLSAFVLIRFKINSAWLVFAGGFVGALKSLVI
jgi:chromate transporter